MGGNGADGTDLILFHKLLYPFSPPLFLLPPCLTIPGYGMCGDGASMFYFYFVSSFTYVFLF